MNLPSDIQEKVDEFIRLFDEMHHHYFEHSDGHHQYYEGGVAVSWRFGSYFDRLASSLGHQVGDFGLVLSVSSDLFAPEGRHHEGPVDEMLEWVRFTHAEEMARSYEEEGW